MNTKVDNLTKEPVLNDRFRRSGFEVLLTCEVQSIRDIPDLLQAIEEY